MPFITGIKLNWKIATLWCSELSKIQTSKPTALNDLLRGKDTLNITKRKQISHESLLRQKWWSLKNSYCKMETWRPQPCRKSAWIRDEELRLAHSETCQCCDPRLLMGFCGAGHSFEQLPDILCNQPGKFRWPDVRACRNWNTISL